MTPAHGRLPRRCLNLAHKLHLLDKFRSDRTSLSLSLSLSLSPCRLRSACDSQNEEQTFFGAFLCLRASEFIHDEMGGRDLLRVPHAHHAPTLELAILCIITDRSAVRIYLYDPLREKLDIKGKLTCEASS